MSGGNRKGAEIGGYGGRVMTVTECALALGCSPQWVSKIENDALKKLRAGFKGKGISMRDLETPDVGGDEVLF